MKKSISLIFKIVLVLGLSLVVVTLGLNFFVGSRLFHTVETIAYSNMENITNNVVTICNTAYNTSVQNYLRASADSAWSIFNCCYEKYQDGNLTEQEAFFKASEGVLSIIIGETGYIYGLDISEPEQRITTVVHPILSPDTDIKNHEFAQKALEMKDGYFEYDWKNPEDKVTRSKSVYFRYFEPWDIVLCASAYTSEFSALVDKNMFRDEILKVKISESDYTTITDSQGVVVVHPYLEGKNVAGLKDSKGKMFIQEMLEHPEKEGSLDYWWKKDKDSEQSFLKRGYFKYVEHLGWYVLVTVYEDELMMDATSLRNQVFYMMMAITILLVGITFVFARFLLKPLSSLKKIVLSIASGKGDLTTRIQVKARDEVGMLSSGMNRFMDSLQVLVSGVKDKTSTAMGLSRELADSAEQSSSNILGIDGSIQDIRLRFDDLNTHIQETTSSTEQISQTISSVAQLIEEQAAAINESSATIEEISGSINNIARIAQVKETTARELVDVTNIGGTNVSDTNVIIQSITNDVESIQEMVQLINGIADQTNLLAMNAAIEAAHAGDAGKGFSVVADEIRKLAETTSENSRSISGNIQSVTEKIQKAMDLSSKTDTSFSRIHDEVEATSSAFAEISSAMKELGISSSEILKAVTTMNEVTDKVRTGASEMESGAVGITQAMHKVKDFSSSTLGELGQISGSVKDMGHHFQSVSRLSMENQEHLESIADSMSEFKTE